MVHLKTWTSFFETFPVGPNQFITEFWTAISGNFGWMSSRPWCVRLWNAFSTHVTAFLDTRRACGGFAAVCLNFCGHEDKPGHKVQAKILTTSYLLERIDIWCKVWTLWVTLLCRDTGTWPSVFTLVLRVRGSFVYFIFSSKLKIENRCQFLIFQFFSSCNMDKHVS